MFVLACACIALLQSEVIWFDGFDGDWESRWVIANNTGNKKTGEFTVDAPAKCLNRQQSRSLKTTSEDAYYQISADIGKTISTYNKTFILAYMVKCEQEDNRVGGAYIKLLSEKIDQTTFNASTPYYMMFGWDLDRSHGQRVQAILRHNGTEYSHEPPITLAKDSRTHLFTFIMRPDYSYEIRLDNNRTHVGNIWQSFYGYIDPPTLPDLNATKPEDWVDLPYIPDPKAQKPADWNDTMVIEDKKAVKPGNWSEKYMGEWKRPRIPNPKYKGSWMPPVIKNPDYKGEWKRPTVPNPLYDEQKPHRGFRKLRYVGIEVFQPMPGTYWDNFHISDSMADYNHYVKTYWDPVHRYEKVYVPITKDDSFSLTSDDLFKHQPKEKKNKNKMKEEEEEDYLDISDEELWQSLNDDFDEDDDDDFDEDDLELDDIISPSDSKKDSDSKSEL